ncbi:MAG: cobalt ECF transporter T component CbiQ [Deltaproteobacteria bacterium]|nr:cobalt ECF transporter T component CbiQ [Deltaproteobacteria bacterium]
MVSFDAAFFDVEHLDRLARQDTPVHRLDPRAKLLTTLAFLVCVVSIGPHELTRLLPYFVFPVALGAAGRVPFRVVVRKVIAVAPFAVLLGIFNPLLDRRAALALGPVLVSSGWISFGSLLLRFCLTVATAVVLIAVTSFNGLCLALDRLGLPRAFTLQLLFLYRYLFVLGEEAGRLARARALRSFGKRGLGLRVFGSLAGQLLLRTMARAQRIHLAMLCRGFEGEIRSPRALRLRASDVTFAAGWTAVFLFLRLYDAPRLAGEAILRILG